MQSAIIFLAMFLAVPEATRGRTLGLLSACIGTQPFGTLWTGFLTTRVGAPVATPSLAALALMLPVAARMTPVLGTPARAPDRRR